MLTFYFEDKCFPGHEVTHVRKIARAICLDKQGKICLLRVHRNDIFGDQIYYETPGGGVDEGESYEEAVVRECEEELGVEVEIISPICHVSDFYLLIGRQNEGSYYLVKQVCDKTIHHESEGDDLITDILHLSIDEAIALMESQPEGGASGLVKQRELPVLYLAKKRLG